MTARRITGYVFTCDGCSDELEHYDWGAVVFDHPDDDPTDYEWESWDDGRHYCHACLATPTPYQETP